MIRRQLHEAFKSRGFIRSVGTLVSASVAGQAVLLAILPLVTRLYDPADFGLFAVFTAILALVLVTSSFRYELAIPLPRGDGNAFALLLLALISNGAVAVASAIIILPWRGELAMVLNSPGLATVLWLLPLSIAGAGTYRGLRLWAIRHHDFHAVARTSITQAVANAACQICCGVAGLGGAGLAVSHFLGQSAGARRLARGMGPRFRTVGKKTATRMRRLARRFIRFPMFDVPAAFVNVLGVQLPNLLLAALFSPLIAGYYMLGERILGTPLGLISQSVGEVLYARSRKALEEGRMAIMATRVLLGLCALVLVPTAIVFLAGERLFALFFGEAWRTAGLFASWLVIGLSSQFLYSSVSFVLLATNAQNINLILQLFMLVAKSSALFYGYWVGSALSAIIAFALVSSVTYLAGTVVVIWLARSYVLADTLGNLWRLKR